MYIEGGNLEKFAANFQDSEEIYTARVYWEHTAKSVLVMEYIDGIKMDQVDKIRQAGIDPKEVAMIGLRSFSRQLMDFGFFHADPHPGNTIVMYDGRVSLVDFGIIGYLDEEAMMQVANIFLGYAEHDYDMVMDAFRDAGLLDDDRIDLKRFRTDLKDMSEPFYGRSLQTIAVKEVYQQVMQLAYKYRIRFPRNLLLLLKTFVQTEGLGKILGSNASILEVTRPYAKKLVQRGYDSQKLLKNLGRDTRTMAAYLKMMPRLTHAIFKRTAEGRHRLELSHTGIDPIMGRFERGLNRAVMGMIISASTIAGSLLLNSPIKVMEIPLAGLSVPLTTLLGVTGYCIATLLGLWLIIAIIRSGKM
jgi:ubiquinone biosynthesis protein